MKEDTIPTSVRLPEALRAKFVKLAERDDVSFSEQTREAIEVYVMLRETLDVPRSRAGQAVRKACLAQNVKLPTY